MEQIIRNKDQITRACNINKVKTLFVTSPGVNDKLQADSDIDFIVDIDEKDPISYFDFYFNLKSDLEKLLNLRIELLERKVVKDSLLGEQIFE